MFNPCANTVQINNVLFTQCFDKTCHICSCVTKNHEDSFDFSFFDSPHPAPVGSTLQTNTVRRTSMRCDTPVQNVSLKLTQIGLPCFIRGTSCFCHKSSDQVLSITPRTQEQVDVMKNISSQHEVQVALFSLCLMPLWLVSKFKTLFPRRQCYGSPRRPSTSGRRPRSTCLSRRTFRKPLRQHCKITTWPTSEPLVLAHFCAFRRTSLRVHHDRGCDSVLGFCWTMQTSWSKCRWGTTRPTRGAASVSTRNITIWRKWVFHAVEIDLWPLKCFFRLLQVGLD